MPTQDGQPDIISISKDALGRTVVVDTEGTTVLEPSPTTFGQSGEFATSDDWGGSTKIGWSSEDDAANNRSLVHVYLYGYKTGQHTYGTGSFNMRANGDGYSGWYVDIGATWTHIATRDAWVGHDAAGACNVEVGVLNGEVIGTTFNNVWGTQTVSLTDYVVAPYAPFNLSIRAGTVATTSFGVDYTRSTYDTTDQDEVQWATDAAFTNVVWTDNPGTGGNGSAGYSNPAGASVVLTPGTTHYVRVRSHTTAGWGGWSPTISQTTLPAVPPGLTITPSPSGYEAKLTMSPPGGATGVSYYSWERRIPPNLEWVKDDEGPAVQTVGNLIPGQLYEWSATAFFGTYESPRTAWIPVQQPKPNTNPGDYFDGDSTDVADLDYGWTGTPHGSTSTAIASGVEGWQVWTASSAKAVLYRVTAGIVGSAYAARMQVTADSNAVSQLAAGQSESGDYRSSVTEGGTYVGSIYVRPSRSQSLAADIAFYDAAGAPIIEMVGAATNVPGGTWMRLVSGGLAPVDAAWAIVRVTDVAGAGWSVWHGGDTMDLDGAMISLGQEFPYFDGNTLPDSTYLYDWTNEDNSSTSTRTPINEADPAQLDALSLSPLAILDPNCVPPAPPRPPTIPSDCITEAGIWRRYFAAIPAVDISDWLDVVPTFELVTRSVNVSQVRIRIYANPTNGPAELVDTSSWISEQIVSYVPAHTVMTIDGVHQRVWAEVAGGAALSADHLLYGTKGAPPTWPVLSCGISYSLSVDLPVDVFQEDSNIYTYLTTRY